MRATSFLRAHNMEKTPGFRQTTSSTTFLSPRLLHPLLRSRRKPSLLAVADYDGDGGIDIYGLSTGACCPYGILHELYRNTGASSITLMFKPLTLAGAPSVFGAVTLSKANGDFVALRNLDGGNGLRQNECVS